MIPRQNKKPARIDWAQLRTDYSLDRWSWVLMELSDDKRATQDAGVLNNLGYAWMRFAEWDRAEDCFRTALTSRVGDSSGHDPKWREGDRIPKSAKEAADQNLYQVSRARDAWMRGAAGSA